jgi:hypothetical protein
MYFAYNHIDEPNPHIKNILKGKADEYITRAVTIKEYLNKKTAVPAGDGKTNGKVEKKRMARRMLMQS